MIRIAPPFSRPRAIDPQTIVLLQSTAVDTETKPRPTVAMLGTRFPDFDIERQVLGDVEIVSGPARTRREVLEVAAGADVILAGAAPRFDGPTLDGLACRGIVRLGVGVDSIDLDEARRRHLWVAHVPGYGTEAVALHTLALALAALRRLPMAERRLRDGAWGLGDLRPLHLPSSLVFGVVGYGRIGRRVAELATGLGFASVLAADPQVTHSQEAELVGLEELLRRADVVCLHAPAPDGGHLLGGEELGLMRPGSVLVNTARGALVDTSALVAALQGGSPAVAALDVYEVEPVDPAIFDHVSDSVILTPHMAWYTEETETELRRQGAAEARRIIDGLCPLHPVAGPLIEQEAPG